jgi:hypothetical protein
MIVSEVYTILRTNEIGKYCDIIPASEDGGARIDGSC